MIEFALVSFVYYYNNLTRVVDSRFSFLARKCYENKHRFMWIPAFYETGDRIWKLATNGIAQVTPETATQIDRTHVPKHVSQTPNSTHTPRNGADRSQP